MKILKLLGKRFGRWKVLNFEFKGRYPAWRCICDCGTAKLVDQRTLVNGDSKSCGCYRDYQRKFRIKHGYARKNNVHPLYGRWLQMISRCEDKNDPSYKYYGHKGIKVCDRWKIFDNFIKDMGDPPTKKHSIERLNYLDGYNPKNCVWATKLEQGRNTSGCTYYTCRGVTKCVNDWADTIGMHPETLRGRLNIHKWDIEKALYTPVRRKKLHGR